MEELVGLAPALGEDLVEIGKRRVRHLAFRGEPLQAQTNDSTGAGGDRAFAPRRRLGATPLRVHGAAVAVHEVLVERVLDVWSRVGGAEQARRIGLVLREQEVV